MERCRVAGRESPKTRRRVRPSSRDGHHIKIKSNETTEIKQNISWCIIIEHENSVLDLIQVILFRYYFISKPI